jgi:HEAT repeat protein
MPFVKRGEAPLPSVAKISEDGLASSMAGLRSPDVETRWSAVRALGGRADAVAALREMLASERAPRVREAIMTALVRVGDEASVLTLLPYLRSQDAGERAAVVEALQALPDAIAPFMPSLLSDDDADVRILATEFARNMPAADATAVLCALLDKDRHPNVCATAVEVLAEVGTPAAIPALRACAERFAGTPFVPFAVSVALARISEAES